MSITNRKMTQVARAGASSPAGTVLAGPIFCRLRGMTPSFYNIAMRIVDSCTRRSGHAVKMPTIVIEKKKEWPQFSQRKQKNKKVARWKFQNIDSPLYTQFIRLEKVWESL